MNITMIGLSHKTAEIEIRERVAFPERQMSDSLSELVSQKGVSEAVIVSTCNRTEIYTACYSSDAGTTAIIDFLSKSSDIPKESLIPHLFIKNGKDAVDHLFSVVGSLDSMVLGEAQIQGQIRTAYKLSEEANTTSDLFNHLFRQALSVGKRIRSETNIGAQSVSVSTAAVNLAKRVFDSLSGRTVLIVGAGEMSELTASYLIESGASTLLVTNRTFENAQEVAERFNGEAVAFENLEECLRRADIVISSTAAPTYVVEPKIVERARRHKRGHSLLLIDIALPRDIDPQCNDIEDVFVYDIDNLEGIIDNNREERKSEVVRAREIIDEEVENFKRWYQGLNVKPTIKQMRLKAERIAEEEVSRALKKMGACDESQKEILEALASAIVKKVLHGPTARLSMQAANPDAYQITESARYLFGLDSNPDGGCGRHCSECARYEVVQKIKAGKPFVYNDIVPRSCAHAHLLAEALKQQAVVATKVVQNAQLVSHENEMSGPHTDQDTKEKSRA